MRFFVGLDDVHHAFHFPRVFISVNRLRNRRSDFIVNEWIMDSGAFSEISRHGTYRLPVDEYVTQIERWRRCGNLLRAASQDWMCEPFIVARTGLTVDAHQRLTIQRYDAIRERTDFEIMPVLQGYDPGDYSRHLSDYGDRICHGQVVGVGSVCKRNSSVGAVEDVLGAIHQANPSLRLHGFGLKTTALRSPMVRELLYSADSMAWSDAARNQAKPLLFGLRQELGRKVRPKEARAIWAERGVRMPDPHDWREAEAFTETIENQIISNSRQLCLFN